VTNERTTIAHSHRVANEHHGAALALFALMMAATLGVRSIDWSQRTRCASVVESPTAHADAWTIDPNQATVVELALLPGVGPSIAQRIIASRRDDGPFQSVDDLDRVQGIGPVTLARVRAWIVIAPGPA